MIKSKKALIVRKVLFTVILTLASQLLWADISGDWAYFVDFGGNSRGNSTLTLSQTDEGKLTGAYWGKLTNGDAGGAITGSSEGDGFEFSFESVQLGLLSFIGTLHEDGTVSGSINRPIDAELLKVGTFSGRKSN